MQNMHNLEQAEEVESEQLTAKEACISWKWKLEAAGYIAVTISGSWSSQ